MNKQYIHIKKIGCIVIIMVTIAIFSSCKTKYENLLRPYNDIERFTIAGYGDVDSLDAVIANNQITIYWNPEAERPEKIAPKIKVSEGATVSPASGTEVAFTETTKYTVTAEDGSTTVYTLKPIFNIPVPSLYSVPTSYSWSSTTPIAIRGQYFLSTGNIKDIKIYLQRVSDGIEFDVPFDESTATTNLLQATLPALTSELDTGAHRLYVKVGNFKSSVADIKLTLPTLSSMISSSSYENYGSIPIGSDYEFKINIKDEWKEVFKRYVGGGQWASFRLGLQQIIPGQVINGTTVNIDKSLVSISDDGDIKVNMASSFFDSYKHYRVYSFGITGVSGSYSYTFPSPFAIAILNTIIEETRYATFQFSHEGKQIKLGEEMTLDVTFDNEADKTTFSTFNGLTLGLKDATTGVYTTYTIPTANRTISGNRITFTIPTTATAVANKQLVIIGATFRGTPVNNSILPRKVLTNTSISN